MKDKVIILFTFIIFLLFCLVIYFSIKANYYKQELQHQQIKYEILIKEPRVRNIIESGG